MIVDLMRSMKRTVRRHRMLRYAAGALVMSGATLLASAVSRLGLAEANVIMVFLLGAVLCGAGLGRGPGLAAAFAGVLLFDFFFTRPHYTLAVEDTEYLVTFGVMAAITVVIADLTARTREQAEAAELREHRAQVLYRLADELSSARDRDHLVRVAEKHLTDMLQAETVLVLPEDAAKPPGGHAGQLGSDCRAAAAELLASPGSAAPTDVPGCNYELIPLEGTGTRVGVVAIRKASAPATPRPVELQDLLDALCAHVALSLHREQLAREAAKAQLDVEAERTRNALLSSVSHDLRTPLASIAGSSSTLLAEGEQLDQKTRRQLLENIYSESERMFRLVSNLLRMAQIEAGHLRVTKEWQPVEEVVGSALNRMEEPLASFDLQVRVPADLPLVPLDGVLIEQVLVNLLDNATRYSAAGGRLALGVREEPGGVVFEIDDGGPGIPAGCEQRIFEKFVRLGPQQGRQAGLGLAICRAVVQAHGGWIRACNRTEGGARFSFFLPAEGEPPAIPEEWTEPVETEASS